MGEVAAQSVDTDTSSRAASAGGESPSPKALAVSIHVCAIVLGSAALYFGKEFFLPTVLGMLGALTLIPIVRWASKRGVPASLSAVVLVAVLGSGLGAAGWFLAGPVSEWLAQAPTVGYRIQSKLAELRGSMDGIAEAGKAVDRFAHATKDPGVMEVVVREPGFLSSATSTLWAGVTRLGVALILVLFLLASGDMVYEKIVRVLPRLSDKKTALRIVHDIERSISRYLLTITVINIGLGVGVTAVMWAVGMPSPALWGVMATLLNFLPYVGAVMGIALTGIVAFISIDPIGLALLAPIGYVVLTGIEGNIVTPLVLGRRLELNTVALFIGVAFWGWVWGLAGVLIAVPLMVVMKTLCDHLPSWASFGEFLGRTPPLSEVERRAEEPDLDPVVKT